jgi:DNA gyrase inhibitor GyrI
MPCSDIKARTKDFGIYMMKCMVIVVASDYKLRDVPPLESMSNIPQNKPEDLLTEIYIPIELSKEFCD